MDTVSRKALIDHLDKCANDLYERGGIVAAGVLVILRDELEGGAFPSTESVRDALQIQYEEELVSERDYALSEMWKLRAENERLLKMPWLEVNQELRIENERLQQKLSYYKGCKGIEDYYRVLSDLRECKAENKRLKLEKALAEAQRDEEKKRGDLHVSLEQKRADEMVTEWRRNKDLQRENERLLAAMTQLKFILETEQVDAFPVEKCVVIVKEALKEGEGNRNPKNEN